ncbi:hypothetical protein [Metabacillus endolithicus]|uniref:Uncharacterized protein n=1 Tax=Metabacillus endolithicus TaxID=1535204 RepID=A0ABW5C1T8_9BACI
MRYIWLTGQFRSELSIAENIILFPTKKKPNAISLGLNIGKTRSPGNGVHVAPPEQQTSVDQ